MAYIEREELLKKIFPYSFVDKATYSINVRAVEKAIKEAPSADVVEVQRGEWITEINRLCAVKCGICGEVIDLDDGEEYLYWNYCPICGAKMERSNENAE